MLLKAGADADKRDGVGMLAIDLAPDKKVRHSWRLVLCSAVRCCTGRTGPFDTRSLTIPQVRDFVLRAAEEEGINVTTR